MKKLCGLYNENSAGFDKAFVEMYQIGIPEVRKYCSPLQALFWMVEDGREVLAKQITTGYILKKLLTYSWIFRKMNVDKKESERWNDFDTVVERLNAPELIDHYIDNEFSYYCIPGTHNEPYTTFRNKEGDCDDLAHFGYYLLQKNGYEVFSRNVGGRRGGHFGTGIILPNKEFLLVINFAGSNRMETTSYKDISKIDEILSKTMGKTGLKGSFWFW